MEIMGKILSKQIIFGVKKFEKIFIFHLRVMVVRPRKLFKYSNHRLKIYLKFSPASVMRNGYGPSRMG